MAEEQDTSQERTEQATQKRIEQAREEGQISRSRELNTMAILMASVLCFLFMGQHLSLSLQGLMRDNFVIDRQNIYNDLFAFSAVIESGKNVLLDFTPFLLILFL